MKLCAMKVVGRLRRLWHGEEGMQTMEWILLTALVSTVLLAVMSWFGKNDSTVGAAVWDFVSSWLDKLKPTT